MFHELQATFAQALLAGGVAPLDALISDRIPAERRFAIHVNNVFGLLGAALESAFPVVCRLVGGPFFQMTAQAFVARHPPSVPHLAVYGARFADFLDSFPPASNLPYLSSVARLEWARVESCFAADQMPMNPARLAECPATLYPELVFRLHPSLRLIRSSWPVLSLWQAHQQEPVFPVDVTSGGEAVLVLRPNLEVTMIRLSPGDAALIAAIAEQKTLTVAAFAACDVEPEFDLQTALAGHLERGSFCGWHDANEPIPPL